MQKRSGNSANNRKKSDEKEESKGQEKLGKRKGKMLRRKKEWEDVPNLARGR